VSDCNLIQLGVETADDLILSDSSILLEDDIRAATGLAALLQDDALTARVGHGLWNRVACKVGSTTFLSISDDEIGRMLSNLRGKGEDHGFWHWLNTRWQAQDSSQVDQFFHAAGWLIYPDEVQPLFWKEWIKAGSRWHSA